MRDVQVERCGEWSIATGFGVTQWVAWAKKGPIETEYPMRETGDVRFNFGATREQASARVKAEVLS